MVGMKSTILKGFVFLLTMLIAQPGFAQKRIYLAPDDHTDYMWTAGEAEYQSVFLATIDYYLDQMDATAASPPPYQARWNADGSFWLWIYQKNRSATQFQRLISRIKDGHFSVPLNALVLSSGGTPAEAILRGMYYPGLIQRAYGIDFPLRILYHLVGIGIGFEFNGEHPYGFHFTEYGAKEVLLLRKADDYQKIISYHKKVNH